MDGEQFVKTFIYFCFIFSVTNAQCQFPLGLQNTWISSMHGNLSINTSTVSGYYIPPDSCESTCPSTLECYMASETMYLLRSQVFNSGRLSVRLYTCWDITDITSATVVYYPAIEDINAFTNDRSVFRNVDPTAIGEVCNRKQPYTPQSYNVMRRQGSTNFSPCPNEILGRYLSENNGCSVQLDMCTDVTQLNVKSDNCSHQPFYSGNGSMGCVYNVEDNGTNYLTVFNQDQAIDNINTFKFTCLVLKNQDGKLVVQYNPRDCEFNETLLPDHTVNLLTPLELCPITTTTIQSTTYYVVTDSAVALGTAEVVGLSLGLLSLLLLLLLIVLCICWYHKNNRKDSKDLEKHGGTHCEEDEDDIVKLIRTGRLDSAGSDSADSGLGHGPNQTLAGPSDDIHRDNDKPSEYQVTTGGVEDRHQHKTLLKDANRSTSAETQRRKHGYHEYDENGMSGDDTSLKSQLSQQMVTRVRVLPDGTEEEESIRLNSASYEHNTWYQSDEEVFDNLNDKIKQAEENRLRSCYMFQPLNLLTKSVISKKQYEKRNQIEKTHTTNNGGGLVTSSTHKFHRSNIIQDGQQENVNNPTQTEDGDSHLGTDDERTPHMDKYYHKKDLEQILDDEGFFDDAEWKKRAENIFKVNEDITYTALNPIDVTTEGDIRSATPHTGTGVQKQTDQSVRILTPNRHVYSHEKLHPNVLASSRTLSAKSQHSSQQHPTDTCTARLGTQDIDHDDCLSVSSRRSGSSVYHSTNKPKETHIDRQASQILTSNLWKNKRTSTPHNNPKNSYQPQKSKTINVEEFLDSPPRSNRPSTITLPSLSDFLHLPQRKTSQYSQDSSVSWNKPVSWAALDRYNAEKNHVDVTTDEYPSWLSKGKSHKSFVEDLNKKLCDPHQLFSRLQEPDHFRDLDGLLSPKYNHPSKRSISPGDLSDMYISVTPRSARLRYPTQDPERMKNLLEEFYLDKKYMDRLSAQTVGAKDKCEKEAHDLSENGSQYLNHMACFWEEQKPLPSIMRLETLPSTNEEERPTEDDCKF